ncbi:histidinol dehydrogenase [Pseudonocardia nigra]|uniref:histidinol dehydrogenase n=1 Tax=Pseudonocardia nigra TaxID=1921578 RepID=UPI001C5F5F12|nr:histidinol dehydrogenase [Pseudonocardia nigra]
MQVSSRTRTALSGKFKYLKEPAIDGPPAERDPAVVARVSETLLDISRNGMDAIRRYARELDRWSDPGFELSRRDIDQLCEQVPADVRDALRLGRDRTRAFATAQRERIQDAEFELEPGLVTGYRHIPLDRVGAYLPAGRFPLLSSPSMTVNVARTAGVGSVMACTPPQPDGRPHPGMVYAADLCGADQIFVLGGVQALAAMAFGLIGDGPVDMLVGAGNAYVAEAKRQLFGAVAIDLLAGPSEVAVIADGQADPDIVAADLLGQAEHGTDSPAALVTTSEDLGHAVIARAEAQLADLATASIAGPAWRDHGSVIWAEDRETAAALMDELAPEHLEIITGDDDFYFQRLRNYGSIFLGPWSTVAYSDKGMAGTNHVLPTAGRARYTGGLSVARFLKTLTYQRITREATPLLGEAVDVISRYEGMAAHRATATRRLATYR